MVDWYIGTMGFSYKDWEDVFYPAEVSTRDYLSYYSRVFNAAEIDSTFYGTPKADYVLRWAEMTPQAFKFCLKTPRLITHELGLVGAEGLMHEFLRIATLLEDKLGVVLIQFPPSFGAQNMETLDGFLSELPANLRFAVEIRDRSWYTAGEQTAEMLAKHGVAWAATQYPGLPREIHLTAGYLYVRWIGRHGTFEHHSQERIDRTQDLQDWWRMIQAVQGEIEAFYGFTNNDYAGFAAATANHFKKIAGLPTKPLFRPGQPRLF